MYPQKLYLQKLQQLYCSVCSEFICCGERSQNSYMCNKCYKNTSKKNCSCEAKSTIFDKVCLDCKEIKCDKCMLYTICRRCDDKRKVTCSCGKILYEGDVSNCKVCNKYCCFECKKIRSFHPLHPSDVCSDSCKKIFEDSNRCEKEDCNKLTLYRCVCDKKICFKKKCSIYCSLCNKSFCSSECFDKHNDHEACLYCIDFREENKLEASCVCRVKYSDCVFCDRIIASKRYVRRYKRIKTIKVVLYCEVSTCKYKITLNLCKDHFNIKSIYKEKDLEKYKTLAHDFCSWCKKFVCSRHKRCNCYTKYFKDVNKNKLCNDCYELKNVLKEKFTDLQNKILISYLYNII